MRRRLRNVSGTDCKPADFSQRCHRVTGQNLNVIGEAGFNQIGARGSYLGAV
jgi:hypothetical protein